jgi:hypothetical protein
MNYSYRKNRKIIDIRIWYDIIDTGRYKRKKQTMIDNNNKTSRKNKTNLTVNWPSNTEYFTIKSLLALNPSFVEITLRVRLKNAVDKEKSVEVIGTHNSGKGRPTLIFAMAPVLPSVIEKARLDEKIHIESDTKTVPVLDVSAQNTTPVVVNPVVNTEAVSA